MERGRFGSEGRLKRGEGGEGWGGEYGVGVRGSERELLVLATVEGEEKEAEEKGEAEGGRNGVSQGEEKENDGTGEGTGS